MSVSRGPNPIWFMNNLTGMTLDDTYYAFFLTNTIPYIPQPVYQDPAGTIPWNSPLEFQPSGGLPNNLYFIDGAVYRIEIRQGPSQTSPLIWLIENYMAGNAQSEIDIILTSGNLITNPQFSDVYFNGSTTIATAGTYNIAPGWQLVLTGTGSTTLTQVANAGNADIIGNPPYYLTLNNSGWTTVQLIQTFNNNGALFGGGALALYFLALATTTQENISVTYVPSALPGNSQNILSNVPILVGSFNEYGNAININDSNNNQTGTAANTQIQFNMPGTSDLSFTNIQLIGQSTNLSDNFLLPNPPSANNIGDVPVFQEQSYEREVDHEFHVYESSLLREQKESLLTAWNFANNPWQYYSTTHGNVAANEYTADQTIMIQQNYVATATGNNVNVTRDSVSHNFGYAVTAVTAHNQFALLQYIAPQTIRGYWSSNVSIKVSATLFTTHSSTVSVKARLIYKAGLPGTVSRTDPVASWTENGDPVAAAGYTLIVPPFDPVYSLTGANSFNFDSIPLPASSSASMTLGVLVYTVSNMNQNATADYITFSDISLVPNDFALATQSETFDQTLRKCQYYYEKSYDIGVLPGTATPNSELGFQQNYYTSGGVQTNFYPAAFTIPFKNIKNIIPTMTLYSTGQHAIAATINNVLAAVYADNLGSATYNNGAISWWTANVGLSAAEYDPNGTGASWINAGSANSPQGSQIDLHYVADSRLGT